MKAQNFVWNTVEESARRRVTMTEEPRRDKRVDHRQGERTVTGVRAGDHRRDKKWITVEESAR